MQRMRSVELKKHEETLKNTREKKTRPISSHLDRASVVNKGFIIWEKTPMHDLYTCETKPVSRAGKIAPSCLLG